MRFPDSSGLLLSIVDSYIRDEEMMVQCTDSYSYPFNNFVQNAQKRNLNSLDIEDCLQVPRLYIIAGHKNKVNQVEQVWRSRVKQAFDQLLKSERILKKIQDKVNATTNHYCLESMHWLYLSELMTADHAYYPREIKYTIEDGNLVILIFYWTADPNENPLDEVEQTINFWMDREQPNLKGNQCLIRSFILRNMIGRRVLAAFSDRQGNWGTLLEGGIFLPLADDFEYGLSKLSRMHIGQWTIGEVEEILLNPIYAFGYYYEHIDLISEWFYVLLYELATTDENKLEGVNLEHVYRRFCEYLGKHICPYTLIEQKIIEINQFIQVLEKKLDAIRSYLKGEEETGVSKNILFMMRNRHAYLPVVHRFIRNNTGLDINYTSNSITFDYNVWKFALEHLEYATDSYEKGKKFEELAQYFLQTIPGVKITGVREKKGGRAEVDIYCCNVSYDHLLWKLGALILIECKNQKKKVKVSDIRNLVSTMETKGISGAVIFSRAGFSSVAIEEIKYQFSGGKIIIPISLEELAKVNGEKEIYVYFRKKIEDLEQVMEDDIGQLYL
ncbi:restriction endonuclease [Paenibacillus sp. FSL H7-0331]|uniref:restriction endonuclease n=1 Tax=Paenibacillus sp. FSL H7-0331 TaxID=1920421 RepID=UPI00096E5350|nr:restriction endonuclease [Paenibacillus sp. FSL H7-0331]OMF09193.1 hypothetical protein BK127_26870 [Paenibacillus sp. FSL H7-0331]